MGSLGQRFADERQAARILRDQWWQHDNAVRQRRVVDHRPPAAEAQTCRPLRVSLVWS